MIVLNIQNEKQELRCRHAAGPVVLGRHPNSEFPEIVIDDRYVSRRQLIIEEVGSGYVRFENVGRNDVQLADGTKVQRDESGRAALPVRLHVGTTVIEIALEPSRSADGSGSTSSGPDSALQTVPFLPQWSHAVTDEHPLASLGEVPSAEKLMVWFETLLSVQRSAVGSAEFYQQTAQALVNLVGLDRGLVLLRDGSGWRVVAGYAADSSAGFKYDGSVVTRAMLEGRTVYSKPGDMVGQDSLEDLEAVVASPIFGQRGDVVGVLYGSRDGGSDSTRRGIQPLEAQVVQLLATSLSSGLNRLEMLERLQQVEQLAAVGQVIGYIIHDLRGPLSNVQQLLEMLRKDQQQQPLRREEQLELIDRSLAVSLDLLNDSLEFCRGVVRIEPVWGRFRELLDEHLRLLRMDLETLGVVLDIDIQQDLEVCFDPDRMARVLRNLAKNAAEALQGRKNPRVTIGASEVGGCLQLIVADNGPGLPSEVQSRMFQPFGTCGKSGGTGFGLAIARQLVEAHRGRISVVSGPRGTRFTIHLPLTPDEDTSTTSILPPLRIAADTAHPQQDAPCRGRRVLLAEDGLVSQRLITSLLRSANHTVTIASNGREAFEAWEDHAFDLILMDVELPELDGLAATRLIRQCEPPGDLRTPIIGLTAHRSTEIHAQCLAAGMDDVLIKPLRTDELYQAVEARTRPSAE
jgi:signal transduction histidine kinase/CheY-like chemotaxis protein